MMDTRLPRRNNQLDGNSAIDTIAANNVGPPARRADYPCAGTFSRGHIFDRGLLDATPVLVFDGGGTPTAIRLSSAVREAWRRRTFVRGSSRTTTLPLLGLERRIP